MIEIEGYIDPTVGRYDIWHQTGDVKFYLSDYTPNLEECNFLLLKVVEQTVRDFISLADTNEPELAEVCKEARDFIFDDEYYIDWGERQLNLPMILEILGIDIDWFRAKARSKLSEKDGE